MHKRSSSTRAPGLTATIAWARPADRDQVKRARVGGKTQDCRNPRVDEGADRHAAESQGGGLQEKVLGGMAGLPLEVGDSPGSVFSGGASFHCGQHDHTGRLGDAGLAQCRGGEIRPLVSLAHADKPVGAGEVAIDAGREAADVAGDEVGFEWIEGTGGRRSPQPLRAGHPLGRPKQLRHLLQGQGRGGEIPEGAPLAKGAFDRIMTFRKRLRQGNDVHGLGIRHPHCATADGRPEKHKQHQRQGKKRMTRVTKPMLTPKTHPTGPAFR